MISYQHKPKITIKEQIRHLEKKGILFNLVNKIDAESFLTNNSYFYKLKSYSKNYDKRVDETYINLEFAYLQELSTLDMHFRRFCLRLTLDLEHMLKTKLIRDFNLNNFCDGYKIVDDYLLLNESLKSELVNFKPLGYAAKDVILTKYNSNLAIWNFIEIIEFGKFINFCDYYYSIFPDELFNEIKSLLWSVKYLRNSSAHNNCLLHNLKPLEYSSFRRNINTTKFLVKNIHMSKKNIEKKMQIPTLHDFIISLFVFKKLSNNLKFNRAFYKELHNLINIRFSRNKNFFLKNNLLTSNYIFIRRIIIFLKKS